MNSNLFQNKAFLISLCIILAIIIAGSVLLILNKTSDQPKEDISMDTDTPQETTGPAPRVVLETTFGSITLELYPDKAPLTIANFLKYVESGFYDGTIFHRVIPGFMIQGGGFTADMEQKPTEAPIKNEADNGLKNTKGTIAMARTMVVDSATSQFFINTVDNPHLDHRTKSPDGYGYCVFGRVVEGMDVVARIEKVETGSVGYHNDVPIEPVVIISAKQIQ